MAKRPSPTLAEHEAAIKAAEAPTPPDYVDGWVSADDEQHKHLYARWENGLARRLYEVWRQAGSLQGERWEWTNQSSKAQLAWLAVARAVAGPAYKEHFGVKEIAELTHG